MTTSKACFIVYVVSLGAMLILSAITFGITMGFVEHWKVSSVGGIESGSKVTFRFDTVFNAMVLLRNYVFGKLVTFTGIYGTSPGIEIGDEDLRYTLITAKHGVGFKVNETLDFALLQNTDGVVGYFSAVGSYVGSLLFLPFGMIIGADERIITDDLDTDTRDSLETILQITPKTFKYTEAWLDRSNLSDSFYTSLIGQDLEVVKPQYVVNQKIKISGSKVNNFKAIKYDFVISEMLAAIKELTRITAFSYVRNLCYSIRLLGNQTVTTNYSTICGCIQNSITNESCICNGILDQCTGLVDTSIPLCFDNDPAFLYCSNLVS
jgi:hypothetical protein